MVHWLRSFPLNSFIIIIIWSITDTKCIYFCSIVLMRKGNDRLHPENSGGVKLLLEGGPYQSFHGGSPVPIRAWTLSISERQNLNCKITSNKQITKPVQFRPGYTVCTFPTIIKQAALNACDSSSHKVKAVWFFTCTFEKMLSASFFLVLVNLDFYCTFVWV